MQGSSGDGGAVRQEPALGASSGSGGSGAVRHVGPGRTKPEWDWTTWSPAGVGALGARSGQEPALGASSGGAARQAPANVWATTDYGDTWANAGVWSQRDRGSGGAGNAK